VVSAGFAKKVAGFGWFWLVPPFSMYQIISQNW